MIKFILPFILSVSCFAKTEDVDRQERFQQNLLKNGGFENGKGSGTNLWTASAGSFAIATSGSNLLTGKASATWDAAASADTLTYSSLTIPKGLYGKSGVFTCSILTPSGTATHTLEVTDGSNTLSSTSIISNTNPTRAYTTFIFPTSGSIVAKIKAQANEPSITIDDCFMGPAEGIVLNPLKAQDVFSAFVDGTASPSTVSSENVDWINGNCTRDSTGHFTCTFNSGLFTQAPNCMGMDNTTPSTTRSVMVTAISSSAVSVATYSTSAQNDGFWLMCQKASVDAPASAYKIDTVANSWSGYHDSTCFWTRTNVAYGDPAADTTCTFTEVTNNNFGTVTSYLSGSDKLPGIVFTPKAAGRYYVKASFTNGNSGAGYDKAQLMDGSTAIDQNSGVGTATNPQFMQLSGIVVATDTSAKTVSIQVASSASQFNLGTHATPATRSINWTIFQIDQQFPMPTCVGCVGSSATASSVKLASARLTCSAGSSIVAQDGSWVSSIGNASAGACAVTISGFSVAPVCTLANETGASSDPQVIGFTTAPTTTALSVDCADNAGTDCTSYTFDVICVGKP